MPVGRHCQAILGLRNKGRRPLATAALQGTPLPALFGGSCGETAHEGCARLSAVLPAKFRGVSPGLPLCAVGHQLAAAVTVISWSCRPVASRAKRFPQFVRVVFNHCAPFSFRQLPFARSTTEWKSRCESIATISVQDPADRQQDDLSVSHTRPASPCPQTVAPATAV